MKIRFKNECIGPKDQRACPIPFRVQIAFPRTSAAYIASHQLTGQTDAYMGFCPFTQWNRIVEWLREYHPHADHLTALVKIRVAMKEALEDFRDAELRGKVQGLVREYAKAHAGEIELPCENHHRLPCRECQTELLQETT